MRSAAARLTFRALAVAFAAAALYRFAWMPWKANDVLSEVEARTRVAIDGGDAVETAVVARRNIELLQGIAASTRDDANYYMLYAANARLLKNLKRAATEYTLALRNADHRPEIYYERGIVYMQMGNIDAAVADLAQAARFNNNIVFSLSGELQDRVIRAAGLRKR